MHKAKIQKQNYRNLTSRMAGSLSNLKRPRWFVNSLIKVYKKKYKIDMEGYLTPEKGFRNFNSFFTRKLQDVDRVIGDGLVSPVDGSIFDFGTIDRDNKIFVKHKYYYIDDLICDDFENLNSYVVLYLSPANYHRVHACFDMQIESATYLPGTLLSVRKKTVYKKDRVYCRNERIVVTGNSSYGRFNFVLVGAMMVGKVKLSFDSGLKTNIRNGTFARKLYNQPVNIKKGDEVGYFEMGSSVIILLEDKCLANLNRPINAHVRMGETIA